MTLVAGMAGCAPQAIFFHESTKVGLSATYNLSDSQPISSHFGFKRRIAAVVPGQERVPAASGKESDATNQGDALSLVSKFYVRVGSRDEGIVIRNNFATGNAARLLTSTPEGRKAMSALMHNQVVTLSNTVDKTNGRTGAQVIAAEAARIKAAQTRPSSAPKARREVSFPKANIEDAPTLPDTPEARPTPPPATQEVGRDGIIKPVPDITPTPDQ
jgi:hypothetical protein